MKQLIKRWMRVFFRLILRTRLGQVAFSIMCLEGKKLAMEALGRDINDRSTYKSVDLPQKVDGFEDLVCLFWSSLLNRGLIRLDLDEAAYLYRTARSMESPCCVEIGRFKGGSTFLLAAAAREGKVISVDLHVKMDLVKDGRDYDDELRRALQLSGLERKVDLFVGDSRTFDHSGVKIDLLFIDGDHSYEGVKADYMHWKDAVASGGHIFFHDAAPGREFATCDEQVHRFINELAGRQELQRLADVGSLVHFRKA